jgi:demethylmenaquinone methyltransferase/2-methoxy-6-polyprenyl-1,4-benzoquinol methylase
MLPPKDQRERFVKNIFDRIAGRYDLLNRVISFHLDTYWRKRTVRALALNEGDKLILDLGTGTGDLAFSAAQILGGSGKVVGLDFSALMLQLAQVKKQKVPHGHSTCFVLGSALAPPFKAEKFDAIVTAFVLRNLQDLQEFFLSCHHLLKPGGKFASLDMFPPRNVPFSFIFSLYFHQLVPWIGACLGRDLGAYRYLSDSVRGFESPEAIGSAIRLAGFEKIKLQRFIGGAVCLHLAEKPVR